MKKTSAKLGVIAVSATLVLAAVSLLTGRLGLDARTRLYMSGTCSFAATYAVPLADTSALVRMMDTALTRIVLSDVNDPSWSDNSPLRQNLVRFLDGRRVWARVPLPKRISDAVPGAEVCVVEGEGYFRYILAESGNHVYMLPWQMSKLMSDCGVAFRNKDVPRWTPVLIFFALANERLDLQSRGQPPHTDEMFGPGYADAIIRGSEPLVPPLEVTRIETELSTRQPGDPWVVGTGYVRNVAVTYTLAGRPQRMDIMTWGGDKAGGRVFPRDLFGASLDMGELELPELSLIDPGQADSELAVVTELEKHEFGGFGR